MVRISCFQVWCICCSFFLSKFNGMMLDQVLRKSCLGIDQLTKKFTQKFLFRSRERLRSNATGEEFLRPSQRGRRRVTNSGVWIIYFGWRQANSNPCLAASLQSGWVPASLGDAVDLHLLHILSWQDPWTPASTMHSAMWWRSWCPPEQPLSFFCSLLSFSKEQQS